MIKLQVITHSGQEDVIEVEEYNPQEIAEKINGKEVQVIVFGKNIYSKIDIKYVKQIEGNIEEE